jgi:hypothetical protein
MKPVALLQNTLHAFNHLLDVGEADPAWLGPATLFSLVLLSGLVALMLNETGKRGAMRVLGGSEAKRLAHRAQRSCLLSGCCGTPRGPRCGFQDRSP